MFDYLSLAALVSDHASLIGVGIFAGLGWWQMKARARDTRKAQSLLKKAITSNLAEPLTLHPEVDPAKCIGCGSCTRVCPEGQVLKLINHKATLVSPTKCVGHGECEEACPNGAITLVFGTKTRGMDIPRISGSFETNVPGLYIAGELGGMGLIRNAIKQGQLAARHALAQLSPASTDVDLLVVGAGPAGIAASLVAIEQKRKYLCIEQGSFGGTVYNFPRQKIVMTHPAELPLVGVMRFAKNKVSKEELLDYWNALRSRTGLQIREQTRFETLEQQDGYFKVKTSLGLVTAKKVILAMGVRGSPRKLGLPNEELPKVAYNLLDPEQYQNQDIAVVGGGNAAVEAAQYLAKDSLRNRVQLLVRGETFDRCNEENKNAVVTLAERGKLTIRFNASVKEIQRQKIVLAIKDVPPVELPNDFLFVFAGAELPHKFLMSLGVQIEKKFGESLRRTA